jgi:putative ABC transport system substrate-binding protein
LELLKQIVPRVTPVAALYQPARPQAPGLLREIDTAGRSFDVGLSAVAVRDRAEIERAVAGFAREPNGGLIIPPSPPIATHRDVVIE